AWRNWKDGTISNFVDTTLRNSSQNEIMRLIDIALLCVQANEADRPTMATVLLMLNNHSVTLAVPSEPAFLLNTGSNTSTKKPAQESNYDFPFFFSSSRDEGFLPSFPASPLLIPSSSLSSSVLLSSKSVSVSLPSAANEIAG
ncbi:hypothetical protein HN873_004657, partial [Arachis hypogaea]